MSRNQPPPGIIEYIVRWPFEGLEPRKLEGKNWKSPWEYEEE